jgi:hypothetical protein
MMSKLEEPNSSGVENVVDDHDDEQTVTIFQNSSLTVIIETRKSQTQQDNEWRRVLNESSLACWMESLLVQLNCLMLL